MSDDILFEKTGAWGLITLNRPQALNAITREMGAAMDLKLIEWAEDDSVAAVMIQGEGDRAFCAGGDIRWLYDVGRSDPVEAATFFRTEYKMNARIASYPKPYVALMDGICMGGGVGVSAMASHRIVTERTVWAMPECRIGLIPDVGSSYYLPRLKNGFGYYLGLTGKRLTGADCLVAGLGTHWMSSGDLDALVKHLTEIDPSDLPTHLDKMLNDASSNPASELTSMVDEIDHLFGKIESIESLMEKLEAENSDLANSALEAIRPASPTSLKLTLASFNGAPAQFNECIAREFCAAAHLMAAHDFHEGVRAQIVEKDKNPHWNPPLLWEVSDQAIAAFFDIPPEGPLDLSGLG